MSHGESLGGQLTNFFALICWTLWSFWALCFGIFETWQGRFWWHGIALFAFSLLCDIGLYVRHIAFARK